MNSSNITNNGTFNLTDGFGITRARLAKPSSVVNAQNSTFSKTGGGASAVAEPFSNAGALKLNGLILNFTNGISQSGGSTDLGAGGTLGLSAGLTFKVTGGTVSSNGNATINGNLEMDAGGLGLGATLGVLNITGDYTQATNATLTLKLGGTAAGKYDQLNITGKATLAGNLDLTKFGNFVPQIGNKFAAILMTGKGIAGTFNNIFDDTGSNLLWTLTINGNNLDLTGNRHPSN